MDVLQIAHRLHELTNSWMPIGATTADDLREARLHLADGLSSGIAPRAVEPAPAFRSRRADGHAETAAIAGLAKPAPAMMTHLRNDTDFDPAGLAGVVGMKVGSTLGPFVDSLGVNHWLDLIPLPQQVPIVSAASGVVGYLLVAAPSATLRAGSLWVALTAFNIPQATSGFVGISFSSGTLQHAGNVTNLASEVIIGKGGSLTLELELAAQASPVFLPGLGQDAEQMSLNLPAQITITFTEAGATVVAIDSASATVYGTSVTLTRTALPPRLRPVSTGIDFLLFPCETSIPQFSFQTVLSKHVAPAGQSAVTDAGWALPITLSPPQQLGAASSAGLVVLELGAGLTFVSDDLDKPAPLSSLTLVLGPGQITIWAINGSRDILTRLRLWDAASPVASVEPVASRYGSEINLTIARGALLAATTSGQFETIVAPAGPKPMWIVRWVPTAHGCQLYLLPR